MTQGFTLQQKLVAKPIPKNPIGSITYLCKELREQKKTPLAVLAFAIFVGPHGLRHGGTRPLIERARLTLHLPPLADVAVLARRG
jgi:hypothetical protein